MCGMHIKKMEELIVFKLLIEKPRGQQRHDIFVATTGTSPELLQY